MSDYWFPNDIKPLVNKPYSFERGNNLIDSPVAGGLSRSARRYSYDPVTFKLNFVMCDFQYQVFDNFYNNIIDGGASTFKMMLWSAGEIREHQVRISGKVSVSRTAGSVVYVGFSATAQVTPSQLETCPNIYDIYQCYGKSIFGVLDGLESLIKSIPPHE